MPSQQPAHRSILHQLPLPFDLSQPGGAIPRSLDLLGLAPQQVWQTLTEEQRSKLRQQLIQTLQEVMRRASQY
jgi:hypothetical protein